MISGIFMKNAFVKFHASQTFLSIPQHDRLIQNMFVKCYIVVLPQTPDIKRISHWLASVKTSHALNSNCLQLTGQNLNKISGIVLVYSVLKSVTVIHSTALNKQKVLRVFCNPNRAFFKQCSDKRQSSLNWSVFGELHEMKKNYQERC